MDVKQTVALVTGGGSGLGKATCEQLAAAGAKVFIFDMNAEAAAATVKDLGEDRAGFAQVNVSDEASVLAGFEALKAKFGKLNICVNCAGIATAGKILDRENKALPLAEFSKTINVNLVGSFNVARVAAELMAANEPMGEAGERGIIINTASVAAFEGQLGQCAYSASKGGIVGMTLPMARDLAKLGIRVNAIAPGIMGTPMLLAMPDNVQESLVANIQFPKRMGLPKEYGDLVVHLASNSYINGEVIRLDGAIRMQPR
ncbi:SDR family NAD(P)-dependent oxidoreductase [Simiduia agarivorans]|uniref:NAD-dependent epimerase/dehydratase n=1 Tax=Simiduia agarivorans (strain DSM 21679 / JCM 13881 / BCRC 17597 / SA1) TaxID=1117647 RepID=K4KPB0_SIMAS|nr:SDR family NAD(P)-dependent oxidoreductase [Simiduia agarivorans]AFV00867.1 NAD-dependent epimerase/dehydratase [Simiduia agarivorans SA1 = DSM 21679]